MTIEERLQRLEDDRAIRDVKARYLRACDTKDVDALCDTLLPEAKVVFEGFPPCDNREAFLEIYRKFGCAEGVYDIHHAANGIISLASSERAVGQWSLTFYNVNLGSCTLTHFGVEYDDIYVKRDARWWIAETRSRKKLALVEKVDANGKLKVVAMGEQDGAFGES